MEYIKKYIIEIIVLPLVFAIDALIIAEFLPVEWLKEHKLYSCIGSGILILGIIFILEFSRRKKERKEKIERLKALEEEKRKALEEEKRKRIEALNAQYTFIGKSSEIELKDLLVLRPLNQRYYSRKEDALIDKCLENKKNVLIIGQALSGKTRAAYEALKKLNKPQRVAIPKCTNINPTFQLPENTGIIFIDDLHRFVEQQNFEHLLTTALKSPVIVVATSRTEEEYEKVKKKMSITGIYLETIFDNIINLPDISKEEGKKIANDVKISWDEVKDSFKKGYGNIGEIFMSLSKMVRRFDACTEEEKTVLQALRSLYFCGIYEEKQLFPLQWIKIATKKEDYDWTALPERLRDKKLIALEKDKVRADEVYLETIFIPPVEKEILDVFEEMITTFSDVPEALFSLGNRAYNDGIIVLEKTRYMKIAIRAFEEALKISTLDRFPMQYAATHLNLGSAYVRLAEVEAKAENCKKAIEAYEEALKVYTLERFPTDYAMTQWGFGAAFHTLAEVENKAENCKKAIEAYEEALKVSTLDRFPMDYAMMTQNNLGNAYRTLAEVEDEDKAGNCGKAINAYMEALKVLTLDRFPMDYAMTQNNLGNAYKTLAEVEEKAENCKKAIRAYEEALKVYKLECFPMQYATTQNNLGNAYCTLAGVEEKAENCKKAFKAYNKALKVFKKEGLTDPCRLVEGNLKRLLIFCGGHTP